MIQRDHGGGLDAAIARFGGKRAEWIDLSTGINPSPYPVGDIPLQAFTDLPDQGAMHQLLKAAREFWNVPNGAKILAAPGASALIARMPDLTEHIGAFIPEPTYNEHAAAFRAAKQLLNGNDPRAPVHIYVHPNNPDGRIWPAAAMTGRALTVIDESFCDVTPGQSHVALAELPGTIILKSFGKFWGLAGLRLGFAIAAPTTLKRSRGLEDLLGPWPVSGPAIHIGQRALSDHAWASTTRQRLERDAARLDALLEQAGASLVGGTSLFRLFSVPDAALWQVRLARHKIWSRIFPYSQNWLRLGLPSEEDWDRVEAAL